MAGEPIPIGPFMGGLNTFSDYASIADDELAICENFELDLDGSLKSRPPVEDRGVSMPLDDSAGNAVILDYYFADSGVAYLIASDGNKETYYFNGLAWVSITDSFAATTMVQFDGKAWLMAHPDETNPGGYWTPSGGFVSDDKMPKGDVLISHKSRLWAAEGKNNGSNGTSLYYSYPLGDTDGIWRTTNNEVTIGAGDGQDIVAAFVYYNSLLIFRSDSIYTFNYSSSPAQGTVSLLTPGVGLQSRHAVVAYENYIYFMYDDDAYEFLNNRATKINLKVPFISTSRANIYLPHALSVFNGRILFTFWNMTYVYGLKTKTWSVWNSTKYGAIGRLSDDLSDDNKREVLGFSSLEVPIDTGREAKTLFINDVVGNAKEDFVCTMRTKNFNYEAGSMYKRLFWWGADLIFLGNLVASAVPVVQKNAATWGQLTTWGHVAEMFWGSLGDETSNVDTEIISSGASVTRKFVKFRKGLRFRQIFYRLVFKTDGSKDTAPVRVFSLTTYVSGKEKVSKTIT